MTKRGKLSAIVSTTLLAAAMVIWPEMFNYAKVVYFSAWTKLLPFSIDTPAYLALICLLPAAIAPARPADAQRAIAVAVLLAPVFATAVYATRFAAVERYFVTNTVFNYFWIVFVHCAIPALILMLMRAVVGFISAHKERW